MVEENIVKSFDPTSETPPDFPGVELFSEEQATLLGSTIRDFTLLQPFSVQHICETNGIGWQENGSPDIAGVNRVECIVKTRGCAALALEATRALGGELSSDDILNIVQEACLAYELIPQAVHAAINTKKQE